MKLTVAVSFCFVSTVVCQFSPVYQRCSYNTDCPDNSACRAFGCNGYVCLCDMGYVVSQDYSSCLLAGNVSDTCDISTVKCLGGVYAYCRDGQCQCNSLARVTELGTCVSRRSAKVVGASCTPTDTCVTNAECVGGSCQCILGYRERSLEEYWSDPESREECVAVDFSLTSCNGVPLPTTTSTTTTSTTTSTSPQTTTAETTTITTTVPTTTTTTTTTTTPTTTTTEVTASLTTLPSATTTEMTISSAAVVTSSVAGVTLIFDNCTSPFQCPNRASCRPNGCNGLNCLCDWGFAPSSDRTSCLNAGSVGTPCGSNVKCLSPFASCLNSFCDCIPGYRRTVFYTCTLPNTKVLGEYCQTGLEECGILAECRSGFCQCQTGFRQKNTEEFWADPESTLQCVPDNFSLYTCQNENVSFPVTTQIIPETATTSEITTATSERTTATSTHTTTAQETTTLPTTVYTTESSTSTTVTTEIVPATTDIETTTTIRTTAETTSLSTITTTSIPTTSTTQTSTTSATEPVSTTLYISTTIEETSPATTETTPRTEETTEKTTESTTSETTRASASTLLAISSTEISTTAEAESSTVIKTTSTSKTAPATPQTSSANTLSSSEKTSSSSLSTKPDSGEDPTSRTAYISTSTENVEKTSKLTPHGTQLKPIQPDSNSDESKVAVIASACTAGIVLVIIVVVIAALCAKRHRYKRRLEVTRDQARLKTYDNVELPSAGSQYMMES